MQRQYVFAQIDALLFLELSNDPVNDALVKVFTTQEGVAVSREHFELLLTIYVSNFNNGYVECTAAQVIHSDLTIHFVLLVETKCQCCSGWLVDDALDIQTSNTASIFSSLTLAIVEVSRNSNHCLSYFLAEIVFGCLFHFAQNFCWYLLWRHFFITRFNPSITIVCLNNFVRHQTDVFLHFSISKLTAHQTLHRVDGVFRIGNWLAFCRCANQYFAVFNVSNDGWSCTAAFCVLDNFRCIVFNNWNARVCGS